MMNKRIEQLLQFLVENPQDPFLHYALAMEYGKAGEIALCQSKYEHLLNVYPDYVGTYYHATNFYHAIGQIAKSRNILEKGLEIAHSQKDQHSFNEMNQLKASLDWE